MIQTEDSLSSYIACRVRDGLVYRIDRNRTYPLASGGVIGVTGGGVGVLSTSLSSHRLM